MTDPARVGGVLTVLGTPFADDERIDLDSLRRLVEHVVTGGSDGVVCFGLASEAYKLDDDERRAVLTAVVEQVAGRVLVVAGTEHSGHAAAVRRTSEAAALGADAFMLYPPTFVKPDQRDVIDYYVRVAAATPLPIIVQDAPAWTGVPLPLDVLTRIRASAPTVTHVKVENPPGAGKIRELVAAGFRCLSGYGALHLPEEHRAGVSGVMPGCALPHTYTRLWRLLRDDPDAGGRLHADLLPLLSFQMASLDTFVAAQKHLLLGNGVIAAARVRAPGRGLDDQQRRWLDDMIRRLPIDPGGQR